ncbi:RNA-binding protein [Roseofilum sp. BLCC_M91]|uniref:RNA-binding protein n=1 Tax=Roseofilum halophilum BLCC-M91 TaxID=3022259 RepID=A0ABT7BDZ9_9CYAN|nr:RNA-binding protein [Roseofilum halophilum]MDJ1177405.1 RNA-binding protein [Roseofilum halophilum BLCC-M91]
MSVRLYVGNLPKETEKQELEAVFAETEPKVSTKVITDRKTGKCRGFGFVTVKNEEQADQIIEQFNGYLLNENALKIEKAQPRNKGKEGGSAEGGSVSSGSTASSSGGGNRKKNKSKKSSSGSSQDSGSIQPDPRWAADLEKLKEMLAAQTAKN